MVRLPSLGRVYTCSHVHQKSHHWPSVNRKFVYLYLLVLSFIFPFFFVWLWGGFYNRVQRAKITKYAWPNKLDCWQNISMCAMFNIQYTRCVLCKVSRGWQARARLCTFFFCRSSIQLVHVHLPVASAGQFGFSCRGWVRPQPGLLSCPAMAVAAPPQHCFLVFHWLLLFFTCCWCSSSAECPEKQQPLSFISPLFLFSFFCSSYSWISFPCWLRRPFAFCILHSFGCLFLV